MAPRERVRTALFLILTLLILGKKTALDWAMKTISGIPTVYRNKCVFQEKRVGLSALCVVCVCVCVSPNLD